MTKRTHSMSYALIATLGMMLATPALSNGQDVTQEQDLADRAYVPPASPEPALPSLPPTPVLTTESYPDCREDFQKFAAPFDKAKDINRCTALLDRYYAEVLTPFRERMIEHQNEISAIFTSQVAGKMVYTAKSRNAFYQTVMKEHAASDPQGANLSEYRDLESRYQQDRAYLQDRFCFNTGCGGYEIPEYVAADKKASKSKKDKQTKTAKNADGPQKCKKARGRGGLIGGILGGVAGNATGLGNVGTLISSGVGALLVGEIACQLTEKEQKEAAKATVAVTKEEKLGATASWKSPTRSGVSGSSTVTALNTRPNGQKCLSITDVAIIEGKETRVSKQMCRGQGDEGYVIVV
ncbi:hypothetical protein AB1K62_09280 [Parasphingorhabdus sp. JC815]|uniref:hypothetical protein n=1 Tax=Parasphingorhabdus sp. JC815 TaxID=3232140 RepID=UPI0034595D23